jgi:hypothetical protein
MLLISCQGHFLGTKSAFVSVCTNGHIHHPGVNSPRVMTFSCSPFVSILKIAFHDFIGRLLGRYILSMEYAFKIPGNTSLLHAYTLSIDGR